MENLRLILWYLCMRCQHITRELQAASTYKRWEIWHETHEPMWLLIGHIVFLHVKKKTLFAILVGDITFFTCEKHHFAPLIG